MTARVKCLAGDALLLIVCAASFLGVMALLKAQEEPPIEVIPSISADCPNGVDAITIENGYVTAITCAP